MGGEVDEVGRGEAAGEGVDVLEADLQEVFKGLGVEGTSIAGHYDVVEFVDAHAGYDGVGDAPVDEGNGISGLGHHFIVPPDVCAEA